MSVSATSTADTDVLYGDFSRNHPDAASIGIEIRRDQLRKLMDEIDAEYKKLKAYENRTGRDVWNEQRELMDRWEHEIFLPSVVPAPADRYRHWLEQWDRHGRQSSTANPLYPSPQTTFAASPDRFYLATDWTIAWSRTGLPSFMLIVPKDIRIDIFSQADAATDWALGNSSIFWESDWSHQGLMLPLYADVQLP